MFFLSAPRSGRWVVRNGAFVVILHGIDLLPVFDDGIVQMTAGGDAAFADIADDLTLFDILARLNDEIGHVGVARSRFAVMLDTYIVAEAVVVCCIGDLPVSGGIDRIAGAGADIDRLVVRGCARRRSGALALARGDICAVHRPDKAAVERKRSVRAVCIRSAAGG